MSWAIQRLTVLLATLTACSGGESGSDPPDSGVADVFQSNCGHPGDLGNSLGVGKFCMQLSDCSPNTKATLCTTIADPENFFCTFACSMTGAPDQCGENATCMCQGNCGCMPNSCLGDDVDAGTGDAFDDASGDGG